MTTRNKVLILSSLLLAILVIASVILWRVSAGNQDSAGTIPIFLLITIVAISVLSVFVVYFLKIKKRKFEKNLNKEYYERYEIIKDAIVNSQLPAPTRKDIIEDVLDLLLTAQNSGKSINAVVENTDVFVKNIIQSYAQPFRLGILSIFDSLIAFVLMVVGASTFMWLEQTSQSFFSIKVDFGMVIFFGLVAFLLFPVTKTVSGTRNPWIFIVPVAGGILFVLLSEVLRAFFYDINAVQYFLDGSVRMIPNVWVLAIYLLVIPMMLMIKQIFRKQLMSM
jgi:DNA-binding ferritin-like protein (Dps family)